MDTPAVTLLRLILGATEKGYDVTISVRQTSDGRPGRMMLPSGWADELGITKDMVDAAKT